jgi:mono/diheme cytochrome c family protein
MPVRAGRNILRIFNKGTGRGLRVLIGMLAAIACIQGTSRAAEPAAAGVVPASVYRGETVYSKACAACHGENGDGISEAGRYLNPLPRNFASGMFKFRSTPSGELPTDADLLRIVDNGIPGTQMPAWKGVLTHQERLNVVAFLKTFSPDFNEGAAASIPIAAAPESTPQAVQEGKLVYMLMECWACHGGKGKGDGKSGKTLVDDWGHKILPLDLTTYRYKAGNDPETLYRTITTGLNGTPMPAYALDGFLIGGDAAVDPAKYREAYKAADIDRLQAWLLTQPTEAALQQLPADKRNALGERRKWALVHYIRSLIRKPNIFLSIFTRNTEVTP